MLSQFLCSVYLEENSENYTVDCSYYFWISYKILWILIEYWEFGDVWKHLNKCVKSMHSFRSGTHFDHFGDWLWLIMHSFCVFWVKHGHLGGHEYSWTFMELLAWLMRNKKTNIQIGNLFMSYESFMSFTKKISTFVSLIASLAFNGSFWGGVLYLMDLWMKYERWGEL